MNTIAQDAAQRAEIKEDRKLEEVKPVEDLPKAPKDPVPPKAAPKKPAKQAAKKDSADRANTFIKPSEMQKDVQQSKTAPKADAKPKANASVAPKGKGSAAQTSKAAPASGNDAVLKMPKALAGAAPIYMLFATTRTTNVAVNRSHDSLNNMQNQLFLGVSVDKSILETAKTNYTKEFPHLYFWIATKKVLGEMPKDLGLALQLENVLVARGIVG